VALLREPDGVHRVHRLERLEDRLLAARRGDGDLLLKSREAELEVERRRAAGRHTHLLRLVREALHVRKDGVSPRRDVLKLEDAVLVRLGRAPELDEVDDDVVKRRAAVGQLDSAAHGTAAALRLCLPEQPAVETRLSRAMRREELN
jgi:hypothetical protein